MTDRMSEMMQEMAGKMKDTKLDEMKKMSKMMQDMFKQMHGMSLAMGKETATKHKMKIMQDQMMLMQKRMAEMEGKK